MFNACLQPLRNPRGSLVSTRCGLLKFLRGADGGGFLRPATGYLPIGRV